MLKIQVIIGSTRPSRFSEKPAQWIFETLKKNPEVDAELLDLRDYPLPFFAEPVSPSYAKEPYTNEIVQKWTQKIGEADGYIIVTPEYNHGYPAVLKNALDYVYHNWNKKPVGFVSYGSVGGARAVEQLREVAVELQMVPIRSAIHISGDTYMAASKEENQNPFEPLNQRAEDLINQLLWWAKTLKSARESTSK